METCYEIVVIGRKIERDNMMTLMRVLAILGTTMLVRMMMQEIILINLIFCLLSQFSLSPSPIVSPFLLVRCTHVIRVFLTLLYNKHERLLQVDHRCIDSVCFPDRLVGVEGDKGKERRDEGREEGTHTFIYLYQYLCVYLYLYLSIELFR